MHCIPKRKCNVAVTQSSVKMGMGDMKFQEELLESLQGKKGAMFSSLLNEDVNLEHKYPPDSTTLLMRACDDVSTVDLVKTLLDRGANPNTADKNGLTALHHATVANNLGAVQLLLKNKKTNINALDYRGRNALHYCSEATSDIANKNDHLKCISLLMKHPDIQINRPDKHGNTPLTLALLSCYSERIKVMLDCGKEKLNIDWSRSFYGKQIRDVISRKYPELSPYLLPYKMEDIYSPDRNIRLLAALQHRDLEMFRQILRDRNGTLYVDPNFWHDDPYYSTCIELACRIPQAHKFVALLLESGADPNTVNRIDAMPLIHQATLNANFEALKILLNTADVKLNLVDSLKNTPLHLAAQAETSGDDELENLIRCIILLLDHKRNVERPSSHSSVGEGDPSSKTKSGIDIDAQDWLGDTALHEAAYFGNSDVVLTLLRRGANMMIKNIYDEPPLAFIDARTLRIFFDEQISSNGISRQSVDYEIIMKYNSIIPVSPGGDQSMVSEMDPVRYISDSEDMRSLLKHPLLTSFLFLKWRCVRSLFLVNLLTYIIFVIFLTTYAILINIPYADREIGNFSCVILNSNDSSSSVVNKTNEKLSEGGGYMNKKSIKCGESDNGNCTQNKLRSSSDSVEVSNDRTNCTMIMSEEDFIVNQCIIPMIRCFLSFYLIFILIREFLQLITKRTEYFTIVENILEICLILGTAILISSPLLTTECKKHISAIVIILAWTELILISGRLPMLSIQLEMLKKVSLTFSRFMAWYSLLLIAFALSFYLLFKDNEPFFTNPGLSMLKSVLMMAGEFEASNIPFQTVPVTSHILFTFFVFLITIILLNLLNGLAVSDTQSIKEDAAILSLQSLVEIISYIESILLRFAKTFKPLYNNYLKNLIRPRVLLFDHSLAPKQIHISTYSGKTKFLLDCETTRRFKDFRMNKEIMRSAVEIVTNRRQVSEIETVNHTLVKYKKRMDAMENILKQINDKVSTRM